MSESKRSPTPWEISMTVSTHDHPTRFWKTYIKDAEGFTISSANGETEAECRALAEDIIRSRNAHDDLLAALNSISLIGGNLPDDRLTGRTGPNDAHMRGLMYTEARKIALNAIAKAESK